MSGFVVDFWETLACSYCGAQAGDLCVTRNGFLTTKSHSPRVFWIEKDPPVRAAT